MTSSADLPRSSHPSAPQWDEVELFLAGQASLEARARIEAWLETSPEAQALLAGHRQAITNMLPQPTAEEAMATLQSVQRRIAASPARGKPTESRRAESRYAESRASVFRQNERARGQRWGIAATAVGALGYIAVVMALATTPVKTLFSRNATTTSTMHAVTTAPGQHARFHLPDGTSVMLAPGSALQYETAFGDTERTIDLDGEALFTVTHRAGAPFTVRVADRSVQVLGTTFAVRQYASDTAMHVVVAEGRVSVMDTVLGIGDAAVVGSSHVSDSQQIVVEHGVDIASALAWTSGRLVFDRTPLREVLPEFARWYGITMTTTDEQLLETRVTTTLDSRNLQESLDVLAALVQAHVVRTENGIHLRPK